MKNLALPGARVSACRLPAMRAESGGDWCEAFELPGGRIALSIGDVRGHDFSATLPMARVRAAIRRDGAAMTPGAALASVNRELCAAGGPLRHVTAILAHVDLIGSRVQFASAGHPQPLLAGDEAVTVLGSPHGDLPLGVERNAAFAVHEAVMTPGMLLVLFTDGVVERRDTSVFGEAQLVNAVRGAQRSPRDPAEYIAYALGLKERTEDDATLIALRMLQGA